MLTLSAYGFLAAPAGGLRRTRLTTAAIVTALHLAAIWALLQVDSVREQLLEAAPIMVSLIAPPQVKVAPPAPEPQKTRPVEQQRPKAPEIPPVITASSTAASVVEAPTPQPEIVKPREIAPAPASESPPSPPRFDAAYLQNPAPPYPALSRRLSEQGKVVLRVLVSATGDAEQVELRASSGYDRLDRSALDTVRKWKFIPARQNGQAVAAAVLVPISFTLER